MQQHPGSLPVARDERQRIPLISRNNAKLDRGRRDDTRALLRYIGSIALILNYNKSRYRSYWANRCRAQERCSCRLNE